MQEQINCAIVRICDILIVQKRKRCVEHENWNIENGCGRTP